MNDHILELIKNNRQLIRLLAIIDANNSIEDEKIDKEQVEAYRSGDLSNAFRTLEPVDVEYYNFLFDKWTKETAEDKLEAEKKNRKKPLTDAEATKLLEQYKTLTEGERGLYNNLISNLKKKINTTFINKAFFTYYELAYINNFIFSYELTIFFYLIEKYKNKAYAEDLKDFLIEVLKNKGTDPYKDFIEKYKITDTEEIQDFDFKAFFDAIETGIAFSELVYYGTKGQDFTSEIYSSYKDAYEKDNGDYIEDAKRFSSTDADLVSNIVLNISNYVRVANLYENITRRLTLFEEATAKKYGLDITLADEELKLLKGLHLTNLENLSRIKLEKPRRTSTFKTDAIKEVIKTFSLDKETKEELLEEAIIDELIVEEVIEEPTSLRISQTRDHSLNDLEPISKEWLKVNVSETNTNIIDAHNTIATYSENTKAEEQKIKLDKRRKQLEDLKNKENTNEKDYKKRKSLEKEIAELEESIRNYEEQKEHLQERIKERDKNIAELSNYYFELNDDETLTELDKISEKKKTQKTISKLQKEQELDKKATNKGLFLQVTTNEKNEELLSTTEGDITLTFKNSENILKQFTHEGTTLLRYIQNIVYETPLSKTDDYILIDLEKYTEETGRNPSNYRKVRKQLGQALALLKNEYFEITGNSNKYNVSIEGSFVLIDAMFLIKVGETKEGITNTTTKTTFVIHLGKAWRDILLNERVFQWASIPKIIERINKDDIRQLEHDKKGVTTALIKGLGYYLYETLRKNLKGKGDYRKGDYRKTFIMKTIVNKLLKQGLLQVNSNRYSRRIIEPIQEALNFLEDIGLIEYNTNAFKIYEGDEETGEKGLKGSKEEIISKAFEDARIEIKFKVYDKETYDRILEKNRHYKDKAEKHNKAVERQKETLRAKKQAQLEFNLESLKLKDN